MSIDDPNPYSRNLFVVSVAFILYYVLDLQPAQSSQVNLLMNTFRVGNSTALTFAPWVALAWFWVSFHVHSRGKLFEESKPYFEKYWLTRRDHNGFKRDLVAIAAKTPEYEAAVARLKDHPEYDPRHGIVTELSGPHTSSPLVRSNFRIRFEISLRLGRKDQRQAQRFHFTMTRSMLLHHQARAWLSFAHDNPAVITYILPHFLALCAVVSGALVLLDGACLNNGG